MERLAPRLCRVALCTAIAIVGVVPASAAASGFCETSTVHNYEKPLESMPPIRQGPTTQKLPFGPANVFFGSVGPGPLAIGSEEVGYFLDYTRIATHPKGKRLDWLVTAKLDRVDTEGHTQESVAFEKVGGLRFPSEHTLAFVLSAKPALYRVEIVFRDGSGQLLGRYGEYVRVMLPHPESRLTLPQSAYRPGEVVAPRLENMGTDRLLYGLGYSIEKFDGTGWSRASISPTGAVLLIGLGSGPGEAASCWSFAVPSGAPPGQYRFLLSADAYRGDRREHPEKLALSTEFEILTAT